MSSYYKCISKSDIWLYMGTTRVVEGGSFESVPSSVVSLSIPQLGASPYCGLGGSQGTL